MLHSRRGTIWLEETRIEDTSTYLPVQAAHNVAAMQYARSMKARDNAGTGADGSKSAAGQSNAGVTALSKWNTAHPMASVAAVGNVLMQSVEPLDEFGTGVAELIPMPNPSAPSANEVRMALARRRMLDRERTQQQRQPYHASDISTHGQMDHHAHGAQGQREPADVIHTPAAALMDAAGPGSVAKRSAAASPDADFTAAAEELIAETSQDSRLVLPVLESLIALRRSRLTRTAPTSQQQQQPYPPQPQRAPTMSTSGGTVSGGGDGAAAAKATGPKSVRRFAPATPGAGSASAAQSRLAAAPDGAGTSDGTAALLSPPGTAAAVGRSPASLTAPSLMQPPPPLSQFPGPFRSTRKWDSTIFDAPGASALAAAAAAAAAAATTASTGPSPSGTSLTAATRPAAAAAAAAAAGGPVGRSPGPSWIGNEPAVERSATSAAGSFAAAAGTRPGLVAAAASAARLSTAPVSPPRAAAAAAAAGPPPASGGSDASVCHTSRVSPRTSGELGLASSADEGELSSGRARALARERTMLQEWEKWRERGGLGPPPGIDEETDGDDEDDEGGRGGGSDDDDDDEDEDVGGLLLGIASGGQRRNKAKAKSTPAAAAAAAEANADEESTEDQRTTWRRARRITQCFDVLGVGPPTAPPPPSGCPAPAAPPGLGSDLASPTAPPLSPSGASHAAGPLSPMASRRQMAVDSGASRGGAGSLGLPTWLNKAFGGGGGDGGGDAAPAAAAADEHASRPSRIPSLAASKGQSFTSKFNRFKERIHSLSHGHAFAPASEPQSTVERASSIAVASRGAQRFVGSNDGRSAFGGAGVGSPPGVPADSPQFVLRQPPAVSARKAAAPGGGGGGAVPDLQIRAAASRASVDVVLVSKPGGAAAAAAAAGGGGAGSRVGAARGSLDARLALASQSARGRFATDVGAGAAAGAGGSGSQAGESLMVTNSVERSRRGDTSFSQAAVPGLLPPVR
ncbi:hypothetical protein PLESTM_000790100 [Pleodorina starrii]|nr:hypothetical protein PLESTM_000790100 [Pleodorina starrii]